MIDFRSVPIIFPAVTGRAQRQQVDAIFNSNVLRADVALKAFFLTFDNGDHHILSQDVEAHVDAFVNNVVTVGVDLLMRDDSGNIDDPYRGSVVVLVIADVT